MSEAWTISREVIIVAIGWLATIWWQSVRFARAIEGIEQEARNQRRTTEDAHDKIAGLDQRDRVQSAANAAASHLIHQQHAEFRELVAKEYATKRDMEGIESRLMMTLDRVASRIETMDGKMDDIRDRLPKGGYPVA